MNKKAKIDPRIEAYLGLKGKPMNWPKPVFHDIGPRGAAKIDVDAAVMQAERKWNAPVLTCGVEGIVLKHAPTVNNPIQEMARKVRGEDIRVVMPKLRNASEQACYSKVQTTTDTQAMYDATINDLMSICKPDYDHVRSDFRKAMRKLGADQVSGDIFVHPDDDTTVVMITPSRHSRIMTYRWATDNNVPFLPHIKKEHTSYDCDNDAFHIIEVERLVGSTDPRKSHRKNKYAGKRNADQYQILLWCESMIDRTPQSKWLSSYAGFIKTLRQHDKKRVEGGSRSIMTPQSIIRTRHWLKQLYTFFKVFQPICNYCIYSSEIMGRESTNEMVLVNVGRAVDSAWVTKIQQRASFKQHSRFIVQPVSTLATFNTMPATNIGTTDVGYSVSNNPDQHTLIEKSMATYFTFSK